MRLLVRVRPHVIRERITLGACVRASGPRARVRLLVCVSTHVLGQVTGACTRVPAAVAIAHERMFLGVDAHMHLEITALHGGERASDKVAPGARRIRGRSRVDIEYTS